MHEQLAPRIESTLLTYFTFFVSFVDFISVSLCRFV